MKRKSIAFIVLSLVVPFISGCNEHSHSYSEEWSYDESYHWHAATCEHKEEIKDKAKHEFTQKETLEGTRYECNICHYTYTWTAEDELKELLQEVGGSYELYQVVETDKLTQATKTYNLGDSYYGGVIQKNYLNALTDENTFTVVSTFFGQPQIGKIKVTSFQNKGTRVFQNEVVKVISLSLELIGEAYPGVPFTNESTIEVFKSQGKYYTSFTYNGYSNASYEYILKETAKCGILNYDNLDKEFNVNFYDYDDRLIETKKVKFGNFITNPPTPARDKYVFRSWYNSIGNWHLDRYCVLEDINLYAYYEADYLGIDIHNTDPKAGRYSISYNDDIYEGDEPSYIEDEYYTVRYQYNSPLVIKIDETSNEYAFDGLYDEITDELIAETYSYEFTLEEAMHIEIRWKAKKYTLSVSVNQGYIGKGEVKINEGTGLTGEKIEVEATVKDGLYYFKGFYEDDNLLQEGTNSDIYSPDVFDLTIQKPSSWTNLYLYMWNETTNNAAWPGVKISTNAEVKYNFYKNSFPNVIFNDGSAGGNHQTVDLKVVDLAEYKSIAIVGSDSSNKTIDGVKRDEQEISNLYSFTMPARSVDIVAHFDSRKQVSLCAENNPSAVVYGGGYSIPNASINISVEAKEGVFDGWYDQDHNFISSNQDFEFIVGESDITLTARFYTDEEIAKDKAWKINHGVIPTIDIASNTITYGMYPQNIVTDPDLINQLEQTGLSPYDTGIEPVQLGEDYYYKRSASAYNSSIASYRAVSTYYTMTVGQYYWFKCSPVVWQILENNGDEYRLISKLLLNGSSYASVMTASQSANKYDISVLRNSLNSFIANRMFYLNDEYLLTTEVDNSATSTGDIYNSYACDNTFDKVFAISKKEFNDYAGKFSSKTTITDYAKATGAYYEENNNGVYWTRSPASTARSVHAVSFNGEIGSYQGDVLYYNHYCIRPCITLKYNFNS